jgi:hypothetical protein
MKRSIILSGPGLLAAVAVAWVAMPAVRETAFWLADLRDRIEGAILDSGTNAKVVLSTGEDGGYSAPGLRPVTDTVTGDATGFQKAVIREGKVDTAELQSVDVALRPGEVTTTADMSVVSSCCRKGRTFEASQQTSVCQGALRG